MLLLEELPQEHVSEGDATRTKFKMYTALGFRRFGMVGLFLLYCTRRLVNGLAADLITC
ncbi:hypothetical protein Aazo_3063 ['Nostoc azollae' 0708]|uniref:Uncharacterized protein n=1 Tax=Nostoc azollae (strain 0708) TaxID=551115 RepID=D7E1Q6_NOSA0|nr:hypothetical protein Aazo_3063 ['Nostoc azollae' 0708]